MVEQATHNRLVAGSNPAGANFPGYLLMEEGLFERVCAKFTKTEGGLDP